MSEIVAKTEDTLAVVHQALRALESDDLSGGYRLLDRVKINGVSIMRETKYLLDRVTAVEEYYREKEDDLSRNIGSLYESEQNSRAQKTEKEISLHSKESRLEDIRNYLGSAEADKRRARERREEASSDKTGNILGAVGFGLATIVTLGLAAPLTLPGATICTINAIEASDEEERAEKAISRASNEISRYNDEIADCRRNIHQLDREISSLTMQIDSAKAERDRIHAERGEIKNSIKYLHDVLQFWKEFAQLTEHGTTRTALLQKLAALFEIHTTRASNRLQLQSCLSAWERVENKLERGSEHLLKINFTCSFCSQNFHSLPHLSNGKFCCIHCCTI